MFLFIWLCWILAAARGCLVAAFQLLGAASLVTQMVKAFACFAGDLVQSLGREDPPEKEMAACSGILAWRIPWTEKPGRLQSMGSQRVGHN